MLYRYEVRIIQLTRVVVVVVVGFTFQLQQLNVNETNKTYTTFLSGLTESAAIKIHMMFCVGDFDSPVTIVYN